MINMQIKNHKLILICVVIIAGLHEVCFANYDDFVFKTDTVRLAITPYGIANSLQEKTGEQWLNKVVPFFAIKFKGSIYNASSLKMVGDMLRVEFGRSGVQADIRIISRGDYIVIELVRLYGGGVEEFRLAQLCPGSLKASASLVSALDNEKFVVSFMALSDRVETRIDNKNMIIASVYPEFGMEGEKVALIATLPKNFQNAVHVLERDLRLPSSKLNGQWAKTSSDVKESYLFTDLTEANADETIRYAKQSGFTYILIYSRTWSTSNGSYPINTSNFPQGEASLKAVIDKCHTAGLKVGMHMLTSFVSKNDPLVRPVPDSRLLKDAEAVLSSNLDVKSLEIVAISGLNDFPRQQAFYGNDKAGVDIQIDDEIIHYNSIGGQKSNIFLQCTRGYAGTKASQHKAGAKIYHLAERYGSYLADLRTPLKEKISERVAGLINHCGFDMIYFDGGEVNDANGPAWYWVSQQQMDIWKRVKRDLLVQGSGMTPWTWHIWGRGTCDDFAAVATKEYLDFYKIPYARNRYTKSFLPAELGWWGVLEYALHHPATLPDEVELYAVRMLALDMPVSLETNLKSLRANGRTAEMLKILGEYEKLRLQKTVPLSVRDRLRSGEWHIRWKDGKPEFQPVRYDVKQVDKSGAVVIQNEFGPQQLKFRLQAVSQLANAGDRSNVVLYGFGTAKLLKPAEAKAPMPGALIERIDFSKQVNEQTSVFMVGVKSETVKATGVKSLDLATHRALAVKLRVEGPAPKPGEPCPVVNIQLESGGKTYRDHYIDLNFTGERTIIIPEPNTERMLREFRSAHANYVFKAAMYKFDYSNIMALNVRWMRQPVGKQMRCSIEFVEALAETNSVIKNPEISVGSAKLTIPVTLTTGDYLEYWGEGKARVFNRNGVQLTAIEISNCPILEKGENRIFLKIDGPASAKLTTILIGDI